MSRKGFILGLVLAAVAIPCVIPDTVPVAHALPRQEVYRYYFSDATKTTMVGEELVTSCGGVVKLLLWGVRTPYYTSATGDSCP